MQNGTDSIRLRHTNPATSSSSSFSNALRSPREKWRKNEISVSGACSLSLQQRICKRSPSMEPAYNQHHGGKRGLLRLSNTFYVHRNSSLHEIVGRRHRGGAESPVEPVGRGDSHVAGHIFSSVPVQHRWGQRDQQRDSQHH